MKFAGMQYGMRYDTVIAIAVGGCCRLSQSVDDDFQLAGALLGALALSSYFRHAGHTVVHAG